MNISTDIVDDLTSPRSSDASGSTSPYRRRFNKQTRREALEQRFGRLRGRGGAKTLRQSLKGGSSKDEDDRSTHNTARALGASSATSEDNHSFSGSVSSDESSQRHHLRDNNDQADYSLDGSTLHDGDQATNNGGRATFIESRYHFIPIPKNIKQEAIAQSLTQEPIPKSIIQEDDGTKTGRPEQAWIQKSAVRSTAVPKFPISPYSGNRSNRVDESQGVGRYIAASRTQTEPDNTVPITDRNKNSFVMQRAQELSKLSNANSDAGREKEKQRQDGSVVASHSIFPKYPTSPERENRKIETTVAQPFSQGVRRYGANSVENAPESKAPKIVKNENSIVMQRAQAFAKFASSQQEVAHEKVIQKPDETLVASRPSNASTLPEVTDSEDHAVLSPRSSLVAQRALEFESMARKIPEPPFRKAAGPLSREINGAISPDQNDEKKETMEKAAQPSDAPPFAAHSYRSLTEDSLKDSSEHATFGDVGGVHMLKQMYENDAVKGMLRPGTTFKRVEQTLVRPREPRATTFYRIVYRGVVALLSDPSTSASRSGAYVSYGEYISSRYEAEVDDGESVAFDPSQSPRAPSRRLDFKVRSPGGYFDSGQFASPESPPRSVLSQNSASVSSLETSRTQSTAGPQAAYVRHATMKAVRVDDVLTGGYAVDAIPLALEPAADTPRRSNTQFGPILGPSPLPIPNSQSYSVHDDAGLAKLSDENTHMGVRHHGFLFTCRRDLIIAEEVAAPPVCDRGRFLYKVISSTPLPILTGPCSDAPKTKAMLLPGTMHEVCLKLMHDDEENQICFLRLSHRKGWIPDRKSSPGAPMKLLMIPVEHADNNDDGSIMSKSGASQSSASTRRHRLPRRRQDAENVSFDTASAPGTPARKSVAPSETPRRTVSHVPDQNTPNTSSNFSVLSDDSSMDHGSLHRIAGVVSPDRSVARSSTSTTSTLSIIYLMRVTAPQGLKILDAPQFQVNNLIHGKQEGPNALPSLHGRDSKSVSYLKTNQSIFQTLAGTKSSKGSPAVFDSISKSRRLPRNVFFEASSQMECFEAFNQGLGLIKLADGSGWAIVPRQEELDEQYRKYHVGAASVKEGEATRAFEEVGNAIVEYPENRCVWLRVLPKTGLLVSCPPPLTHELTGSPGTSSVGGESSSAGGGSNFGLIRDSEVASAVGSVILEAMFRTPKKKDGDSGGVENHGPTAPPKVIVAGNEDAVLPCGLCVEVDRWKDPTDPSNSDGSSQASYRVGVTSLALHCQLKFPLPAGLCALARRPRLDPSHNERKASCCVSRKA